MMNIQTNMFKRALSIAGSMVILFALSVHGAFAQGNLPEKGKWQAVVKPYFMFPNMNGTAGVADLPDVSVDAKPGDIFSHLQMGLMLYAEMENDKYAVSSDLLYMNLSEEIPRGKLVSGGELRAKQFMWEVSGFRKISPWFDAGVGLRLNSLKSDIRVDVFGAQGSVIPREASGSQTWVDPILVARFKTSPHRKLTGILRTDIGGFGIGADFTWQVQADAVYRFSNLFSLGIGYRILGVDYEKGSGQDRFLYNMDSFGPVVKLGFNL
jgi:hypothetical protein